DGWHAGIDARDLDVLPGRLARKQVVALEHEAERLAPEPREAVGIERLDVAAGEQIRAARRPVETAEDVHQRRLSGAGLADDRDELARVDLQVDVAQRTHLDAAVRDERAAEVAQLHQRDRDLRARDARRL